MHFTFLKERGTGRGKKTEGWMEGILFSISSKSQGFPEKGKD